MFGVLRQLSEHGLHNGKHHGCSGRVGDEHGAKEGGQHESQHQPVYEKERNGTGKVWKSQIRERSH